MPGIGRGIRRSERRSDSPEISNGGREGELRKTKTVTQDWGTTVQLSYRGKILGHGNRVTAGVAYDGHQSHFTQEKPKQSSSQRQQRGVSAEPAPFETAVDVRTDQQNIGVYATDTSDITDWLALTLGGRYQNVNIKLRDRAGRTPTSTATTRSSASVRRSG